jgi:transcriptional regulator with XRE-family HTH domain
MGVLPPDLRIRIVAMMVAGLSLRAIAATTGTSKNTVARMLNDIGAACAIYQARALDNLSCADVQIDVTWSFARAPDAPMTSESGPADLWTWTALDGDTRLIAASRVDTRDAAAAERFIADVAGRHFGRVALTSNGHTARLKPAHDAHTAPIDLALLASIYGPPISDTERRPDRKFARKIERYSHALALYLMHYNFVRIDEDLRMTPAMAADLTDTPWSIADIVEMVDQRGAIRRARATLVREQPPQHPA